MRRKINRLLGYEHNQLSAGMIALLLLFGFAISTAVMMASTNNIKGMICAVALAVASVIGLRILDLPDPDDMP